MFPKSAVRRSWDEISTVCPTLLPLLLYPDGPVYAARKEPVCITLMANEVVYVEKINAFDFFLWGLKYEDIFSNSYPHFLQFCIERLCFFQESRHPKQI